jgi:hypothetical protein
LPASSGSSKLAPICSAKMADVVADCVRWNGDGEFVSAQARDHACRRHRRHQPV